MRHAFMDRWPRPSANTGSQPLRYQFPTCRRSRAGLDPPSGAPGNRTGAVRAGAAAAPDLTLLAGGQIDGRPQWTSLAAAEEPLEGVHGIVFFGFPLHPAGSASSERGAHLSRVTLPTLFLQEPATGWPISSFSDRSSRRSPRHAEDLRRGGSLVPSPEVGRSHG